jgi:methylmalonyl-CoA carboxyltransferase small subunit
MKLKVTVDGNVYDVEVEVQEEPPPQLGIFLATPSDQATGMPMAPAHAKAPANEEKVLRSPISGTVRQVKVEAGTAVVTGQTLLVLEAMKMETEITAPVDGTVSAVSVTPGQPVKGGEVLVEFE